MQAAMSCPGFKIDVSANQRIKVEGDYFMNQQTLFFSPSVVGALCPACGASYREDRLTNDCILFNNDDAALSRCPRWQEGMTAAELPCDGDCDHVTLQRIQGTRKKILGHSCADGRFEYNELHQCDCGQDFIVSFRSAACE